MNKKIILDIEANISQIKQSANEMRQIFDKLDLSDSIKKSFMSTFSKLEKETRNFEVKSSQGFKTEVDTKQASKNVTNIISLFEELKILAKDTSQLELKSIVSSDTLKSLKNYQKALTEIEKLQEKNNNSKIEKKQRDITAAQEKEIQKTRDLTKAEEELQNAQASRTDAKRRQKKYKTKISTLTNERANLMATPAKERTKKDASRLIEVDSELSANKRAYTRASNDRLKAEEDVKKANITVGIRKNELSEATENVTKYTEELERLKNTSAVTAEDTQKLRSILAEMKGDSAGSLPQDLDGLIKEFEALATTNPEEKLQQIVTDLQKIGTAGEQGRQGAEAAKKGLGGIGKTQEDIAAVNSEVDMLKSRLTYFFSIANGFQLFKRLVRDAMNSVKELDAAITEMAVVTDYSISDIWGNMGQYVKTATELGATTKDVIKSMVLYTQQGLNMSQATQLSTETMKMARIAGLEGAEATDLKKHWVFI